MNPTFIIAAIGLLVVSAVAWVLYPEVNSVSDNYYDEYVNHCELNGNNFLRLYTADADGNPSGTAVTVTATDGATTCTTTAVTGPVVDEQGDAVSTGNLTAGAIPNSAWTSPTALLNKNGNLSRLVLSVLPITVLASFFGISALSFVTSREYTTGQSIARGIIGPISGLITVIVVLAVLPTLTDFMSTAYTQITSGQLSIMQRFGGIMGTIMGFLIVILNVGLLGVVPIAGMATGGYISNKVMDN